MYVDLMILNLNRIVIHIWTCKFNKHFYKNDVKIKTGKKTTDILYGLYNLQKQIHKKCNPQKKKNLK